MPKSRRYKISFHTRISTPIHRSAFPSMALNHLRLILSLFLLCSSSLLQIITPFSLPFLAEAKDSNESTPVNDELRSLLTNSERFLNYDAILVPRNSQTANSVILTPADNALVKRAQKSKTFYSKNLDELSFGGRPSVDSLIKFDLSQIQDDITAGSLRRATLKLYALREVAAGWNVHAVAGKWNERKVNWNNAPKRIGPRRTKIKMTSKFRSNSWYQVDVTDAVAWSVVRMGQSHLTMRVSTRRREQGSFASKEYDGGRFAPTLELELGGDSDEGEGIVGEPFAKPTKPDKKPNKNDDKPSNGDKEKPGKNDDKPSNGKKPGANNKPSSKQDNDKNNGANKPNKPSKQDGSNNNKPASNKPRPKPSNKPDKPSSNNNDNDNPANKPPPTPKPSNKPDKPSSNNNNNDTPTNKPPTSPGGSASYSSNSSSKEALRILDTKRNEINNELFLYESPTGEWMPSTIYNYDGLAEGLKLMNSNGVAGMYYYLGDDSSDGYRYGLANVAAFLAQSMKETIKYDACDENSWDLIEGKYPLSNACGQLGQSYQDYHCSPEEKHMECPVDKNMEITAVTHAKWYGAPGELRYIRGRLFFVARR